MSRTEEHGKALVDDDEGRSITLFGHYANVGFSSAGGDLPVDRANVITWQIVSNLLEIETATSDS
jgi:hypothetical protein